MEYFDDILPTSDGVCSDNECPCSPSTPLPRGTGYLFVSKETVEFRSNARTVSELQAKCDRITKQVGGQEAFGYFDRPLITGILICEQGARLRGLDLVVATADARHWWRTGKIPLRPTPLANDSPSSSSTSTTLAGGFKGDAARRKWWHLWK